MSSPHFSRNGPTPRAPQRRRGRGRRVPTTANAQQEATVVGPQADDDTEDNRIESPKRARIDSSVVDPDNKKDISPLSAAKDHIESHIASLHDGIADLLLNRGIEYIELMHKIFTKDRNIKRMEIDDGYTPVSARVNFKLQPLKIAEETTEFKELYDRNIAFTETVKLQYKKDIIECAKLELKALRAHLNKEYCETIYKTVSIFHTAQSVDESLTHPTAIKLISDHSIAILKHIDLPDDDFTVLYKTTVDVGNFTPEQIATENPQIGEIKRAIEAVFSASVDKYKKQEKDNHLALTIKKQAKEAILTQKTEEATMLVDDELPVDRLQLNELIKKEAEKLARKLIKDEVTEQLHRATKNQSRGPRQGAKQRNPIARKGTGRGNSGREKQNSNSRRNPNQNQRPRSKSKGRTTTRTGQPRQSTQRKADTHDNASRGRQRKPNRHRSRSRSIGTSNSSNRRGTRS